jgi:hypothetical protein
MGDLSRVGIAPVAIEASPEDLSMEGKMMWCV